MKPLQIRNDRHDIIRKIFAPIVSFFVIGILLCWQFSSNEHMSAQNADHICPIGDTVRPSSFMMDNHTVDVIFQDPSIRKMAATRLSKAVRIPTVVKDNPPSPERDASFWTAFNEFHTFLNQEFPILYSALQFETVNTYGLLYTWQGSDSSLKPLFLTGHIDVVPVDPETEAKWIYPPFSGHFDGENIWGRGSSDCKSLVIATLHGVEKLIQDGFKPRRSVIIGYGFDEEVGGAFGATTISKLLKNRYGSNGIYAMIDEGGSAISTIGNRVFALPSVGEKGSVNLKIALTTPGGHSSVPPEHTNIGIVSQLINQIESNPFEPILTGLNPTLKFLQCVAAHSDEFDSEMKGSIFRALYDKIANSKVVEYLNGIKAYKYLIRTTQAVDIISGGIKANALPEYTEFTTNHRISIESSVSATVDKIVNDIKVVAKSHNLGLFYGNNEIVQATSAGYFNITTEGFLDPAPVTPTEGRSWEIFAGTIKHIIEDYIYPNLTEAAIVVGNLNTGNTDTSKYWDLTGNIYRYRFSTLNGILDGGTHSVNEHTTVDNQLALVAFVYEYLRSVDEFEG